MELEYIYDKKIKSLVKGHKYELTFYQRDSDNNYYCLVTFDLTGNKELNEWVVFSSERSVKSHFDTKFVITEKYRKGI